MTDFLIRNHGSIVMVEPCTTEARAWVEEHVAIEPWAWLGNAFACEPRHLDNLLTGIIEAGFLPAEG